MDYQVASLVRSGYVDGEIADILGCSRPTIQRMRTKLGLRGYERGKKKDWNDPIYIQIEKILKRQIDIGTTAIAIEIFPEEREKKAQYVQYMIDAMAGFKVYAELIQQRKAKLQLNKQMRQIKKAKDTLHRLYKNTRIQPMLASMVREMRHKNPDSVFWANFPISPDDEMWSYNPEAPVFIPWLGAKKITSEQARKITAVEFAIDIRHSWCQGFATDIAKRVLATAKTGTDDELQEIIKEMFTAAGWFGTYSREGAKTENENERKARQQEVINQVEDWVGDLKILDESCKTESQGQEYISEDSKKLMEILEKLEANPEKKNILEKEALILGIKIMGKEEMYRVLNSANIDTDDEIKQIFAEANRFENGKTNKNGNKPNIPLAQAM